MHGYQVFALVLGIIASPIALLIMVENTNIPSLYLDDVPIPPYTKKVEAEIAALQREVPELETLLMALRQALQEV